MKINAIKKTRIFTLAIGDFLLLYFSLFITLLLRYQFSINNKIWKIHLIPFTGIFLLWLIILYIAGAYELRNLASVKKILEKILTAMAINGTIAISAFYTIPGLAITPKTNLAMDIFISGVLLTFWRKVYWNSIGQKTKIKVLFFEKFKEAKELAEILEKNPALGYKVLFAHQDKHLSLAELIKKHKIQLIAIPKDVLNNKLAVKYLYQFLHLGVSIIDFESFYENLTEKIPLYLVNERWFLENLTEINKKTYERLKRILDILMSLLLGLFFLLIFPLIAAAIKINSAGPIFYKQKRVGKNEKIFEIIKFRTMIKDAEKNGAQWAKEKDKRITKIGKFLRKTRLDELPQIWNILKGEMSFIGPRPERPEFVENLKEKIPHYAIRHLIKPGVSGWAQIKFPYAASLEDSKKKLQYDLFYIKNRSISFDLAIIAKTIAIMISCSGR